MHGAVTDVNVFSRILSGEEVGDWARCRGQPGDILDWRTAQLNISEEIKTKQGNETVGCYQKEPPTFVSFSPPRDYDDTLQFCENIGGVIGVASTSQVFQEMFGANQEVCPSTPFYLGFTDRRTEGTFQDSVSGAELTWNNWRDGEPNNWEGEEDCMATHALEPRFNDISCSEKYCPVCQIQFRKQRFQLRGVCREVTAVDRFYVLTGREELRGVSVSKIILNQDKSSLEIVSFNNEALLAFTSNAEFPLGVRPWQFVPSLNCSDPGTEGTHRTLNLHRDLPEPGNFCCDFGTCIDSEMVCNNVQDCEDKSDENYCGSLVLFPQEYRKHLPPG